MKYKEFTETLKVEYGIIHWSHTTSPNDLKSWVWRLTFEEYGATPYTEVHTLPSGYKELEHFLKVRSHNKYKQLTLI